MKGNNKSWSDDLEACRGPIGKASATAGATQTQKPESNPEDHARARYHGLQQEGSEHEQPKACWSV